MATATDPNNVAANNPTRYGYNTVHQLTSTTAPTGNTLGTRAYTYDGFGRLKTLTTTGTVSVTTTYGYDNLDRLRSQTFSDATPAISYNYDADGNLYQRIDATGTTTYTDNAANELTSEAIPGGPTLTYGYDPAGNLTSVGGDGRPSPTLYHYNKADELDQVTEATTPVRYDIFAYNADHQRSDTWDGATSPVAYDQTGNNVIAPAAFAAHIKASFDTADQLTEIKTTRNSSDTTVVADLTYTYTVANPTGCANETAGLATTDRQSVVDQVANQTTGYCYDQAGRLTQAATAGGATYNYGYDGDGNRTSDAAGTHSFNTANQLTDPGVAYDTNANSNGAGNLTATAAFPALAYNSINQSTAITATGQAALNLTYTGTGQALRTAAGNTTTVNGLLGVQAETTAGATTYYDKDPNGTLIGQHNLATGETYYYAFDGQGSVIALIDPTGTQRAAYTYDPYGANATATALNGPLPTNPWRYTGGHLDPTGLYHLNARYYNPTTGTFTQQDTIITLGNPANSNRYAYATDNPVDNSDPSGNCSGFISCVSQVGSDVINGGSIGAVAGGIFGCAVGALATGGIGCIPGAGVGASEGLLAGAAIGGVVGTVSAATS